MYRDSYLPSIVQDLKSNIGHYEQIDGFNADYN